MLIVLNWSSSVSRKEMRKSFGSLEERDSVMGQKLKMRARRWRERVLSWSDLSMFKICLHDVRVVNWRKRDCASFDL